MTSPTADSGTVICPMCGHLMGDHKPSAHFPGMVTCTECINDSAVCLANPNSIQSIEAR